MALSGELWRLISNWPLFWQLFFIVGVSVGAMVIALILVNRKVKITKEGIEIDRLRQQRRSTDR